ncbi:hypothetical protein PF005_g33321 [Phytophthora fragariae]|uniref:Uncharacterized protein n=1 Tax=Phytophthora fragariae TaxID=53985 RepID=A0A6A3UYD5_9STRA|nr:hypothetical protein PF005_g33321 [Phytophthora fragariae]
MWGLVTPTCIQDHTPRRDGPGGPIAFKISLPKNGGSGNPSSVPVIYQGARTCGLTVVTRVEAALLH